MTAFKLEKFAMICAGFVVVTFARSIDLKMVTVAAPKQMLWGDWAWVMVSSYIKMIKNGDFNGPILSKTRHL